MSNGSATTRPVSAAQIMGVVTFTLALFFLVAFVTKTVEAYRLRNWRSELQSEIAAMERHKQDLQAEIERRQSLAWLDSQLSDAGYVPNGVVAVVPVPVTSVAGAVATPIPEADAAATGGDAANAVSGAHFFDNANWRSWWRLIWGFDDG